MRRIGSIDFVRGLAMIIMALDHVRDLMHVTSITQSATDLATTTPILFFTRWITHLCAPTFVFLAGTSAYLSLKNRGDISQSRRSLLTRGLWLILLEFTVVNFALWFDPGFHLLIFEVIAAIGFGFIVLGLLLEATPKTIGIIGLGIIFCHNLFPLLPFGEASIVKTVLSPLFGPAAFPTSHTTFLMGYPPIPWLGIMLAGFGCGELFELSNDTKKRIFLYLGLGALLLFSVLRFINIYGEPVLWAPQQSAVYTVLSFINVTKYPPSLLFCLTTLGIMFLTLAFTQRAKGKLIELVSVYGRVPMFYFLAHFYLIHVSMLVMMFLQGFHTSDLEFASGTFGRPKAMQSGLDLWAIYLVWFSVVAVLYLPCRWFGNYKASHDSWWLKYI